MKFIDPTGLTSAGFVSYQPAEHLTILVKALFEAPSGGPLALLPGEARLLGDVPFDEPIDGVLRYGSDMVPLKVAADVMLVATTCTPGSERERARLRVGDRRHEAPSVERSAGAVLTAFAPVSFDSPQRQSKLGTYDQRWLDQRWPWYPDDLDPRFFNSAPASLQLDGFLMGDEEISVEHVHPLERRYRFSLPSLRVRCFLDERIDGRARFRELTMNLDTLWLDVDAEQLALVWRGVTKVSDEDCPEIEHVYVATEPLGNDPLPMEEHQQRFGVELFKREGGEPAAADATAPAANDNEPAAVPPAESEVQAIARLRDMLAELQAPAKVLAIIDSGSTLAEINAELAKMVDSNPDKAAEMIEDGKRRLLDLAKEHDPDIEATAAADEQVTTDASWTRERVQACAQQGVSMEEAELSGLDLSELDLTGARLARARLVGTSLRKAKLYNADLDEADLRGADLTLTVLGTAKLTGADLTNVSAEEVDLWQADLREAALDGAKLMGARLEEANAEGASFREADLSRANLRGCRLAAARMRGVILHDAALEEANLEGAFIEGARGDSVRFGRANLRKLRAALDVELPRADLSQADAEGSNWMGADLTGAVFTRSKLSRADLSRTKLGKAKLDACDCAAADFTKAFLQHADLRSSNFAGARFELADLGQADLRQANLYEAELWRANVKGSKLDGAHVAGSKLAPREEGI